MDRKILICPECKGAVVYQKNLSHILTRLYQHFKKNININRPLSLIPDKNIKIFCPACGQKMHQHGYMGSKHVIIDICQDCGLLFVDRYELGVMAILYSDYNDDVARMDRAWNSRVDSSSIRMIVSFMW